MEKILIIGSAHVDFVSHVDKLPQGNEEFNVVRQEQIISGTGFKAADVFQHFDFPYELYAPIGTGIYGETVEAEMVARNLPINVRTKLVNGCTYHMVDEAGNQTYFSVPGGEYNFDMSFVQTLEKDDIHAVLLYGEMLSGEGVIDLLNTLDDLEKPIYFVPGEFGDQMDEDVFRALCSLNPTLLLSETDAYYLSSEKYHDFKLTAEYLHTMTGSNIMIFKNDEGVYSYGDEKFILPCEHVYDIELQAAVFVLAQLAGVDVKNSMAFMCDFAEKLVHDYDDFTFAEGKIRLAEIIAQK